MKTIKPLGTSKYSAVVGLASIVWMVMGCQGAPATPDRFIFPTATSGNSSLSSAGVPGPTIEYLISDMPRCSGMEKVGAFKFDWPDIDNAMEKLAEYNWGYYRCAMAQPELSKLYRTDMLKPPYLWREVNRSEHNNGIVVLFFQSTKMTWNYLWMLPGPDAGSSYLVISRSDPGEPQAWECRLKPPIFSPRERKDG